VSSYTPYEPPSSEDYDARPRVILWYRVYTALMTLLSLGFLGFAALVGWAAAQPSVALARGTADAQLSAIVMFMLAGALVALFGTATFIPYKPWGWTLGLVAIGLGLAGGTIIVAIPLLIHWNKPGVKAAFARF
jgi:hypothetical protein